MSKFSQNRQAYAICKHGLSSLSFWLVSVLKSAVNKLGCPMWIVSSFLILSRFSVNILRIFSLLSLVSEANSGDGQGSVSSVWSDY